MFSQIQENFGRNVTDGFEMVVLLPQIFVIRVLNFNLLFNIPESSLEKNVSC